MSKFSTVSDAAVWDAYASVFIYPTLLVADELGILNFLDCGPKSLAEIQEAFSLGPRSAEAVLGMLTATQFVAKSGNSFTLTPVAAEFCTKKGPYYWNGMLGLGKKRNAPLFNEILAAIKHESISEGANHEMGSSWRSGKVDPDVLKIFTTALHGQMVGPLTAAVKKRLFNGVNSILDVGSGAGTFAIAFLREHPGATATLLDLAEVNDIAKSMMPSALQSRARYTSVDMFANQWPSNHDGVMLSNVLHDWGPDTCRDLLHRAYQALPSGGRVFINELLLHDDKTGPTAAFGFSLMMLIRTEGKQYSFQELGSMLAEIGFTDVRKTDTLGYYSVVEGRKP